MQSFLFGSFFELCSSWPVKSLSNHSSSATKLCVQVQWVAGRHLSRSGYVMLVWILWVYLIVLFFINLCFSVYDPAFKIKTSNMAGQTMTDRLLAARHSLAGQGLAKSVCKATTEELIGPKKKHLDCKY